MKALFIALLSLITISCNKVNKQLSSVICISDELASKEIQTTNKHLQKFSEEMLFADKGHFLSGVYKMDNEILLSSIYTGNKTDSIANALSTSINQKKHYDSEHSWFHTNNAIYLVGQNEIVCISIPKNLIGRKLTTEDLNTLIKSCD